MAQSHPFFSIGFPLSSCTEQAIFFWIARAIYTNAFSHVFFVVRYRQFAFFGLEKHNADLVCADLTLLKRAPDFSSQFLIASSYLLEHL